MAAIEDAQTFLYRHPWATTEVDDPVPLLEALLMEAKAYRQQLRDLRAKIKIAATKAP